MEVKQYPRSRRNIVLHSKMSKKAANIIAKNYNTLKNELCARLDFNYRGETQEDIFCNTIIYVIHEKGVSKKSEQELLAHFKRRFNMIAFQTVSDERAIQKHLSDNLHDVRKVLYGIE